MKKCINTLIAFATLTLVQAQDTLVLTNGIKINVEIIDAKTSIVSYKSLEASDNVVREIKKEHVHIIKYGNGTSLALSALFVSKRGYSKNLLGSKIGRSEMSSANNGMGRNRGFGNFFFNGLALSFLGNCNWSIGSLFCR